MRKYLLTRCTYYGRRATNAIHSRSALLLLLAIVLVLSPSLLPQSSSAQEDHLVTLNLKDMKVSEILKLLSDKGNLNMALQSDIKGKLTIFLTEVTVAEALDTVCDVGDLAYVKRNGIYHIMSATRYQQLYNEPFRSKVETHIFELEFVEPDQALQSVQQLRSKDGKIFADHGSRSIIVIDRSDVVSQISDIISFLDQPLELRSYSLHNVNVSDVLPKIQPFLYPGGTFHVDYESNTLWLQDSPAEVERIAFLIREFDKPALTETSVFLLSHAEPSRISEAITPLLTPEVGRIHSDVNTNKVFVTDFPSSLQGIADVIASLDLKTPEVLLDTRIVQVDLKDENRMGVNWEVVAEQVSAFVLETHCRIGTEASVLRMPRLLLLKLSLPALRLRCSSGS